MTPEQLQDLSNNLNDLRAAINQIAGASSIMANGLNRTIQGLGQIDPAFRRAASALGESVDRTRQAGNAIQQEQQLAAQTIRRNAQDQESATRGYVASLRTLTNGLTSAATSLQNLSGVANIAGNAASSLGVKMGAAGEKADAFGRFVDGVGSDILRQAEAYNSLRNALQRLGGAGEQTASSLYAYAKAAGLHQETLNYMLAPMRALGNNILSLGKGAGDAQRAFMEMLQVSDDQRAMFARLGMFQEDLIARQADYVAQQQAAGISIRNMNTDMQSLRKASLDYVRSLYDLSALTGQSIEQEREKQKEAVYERRLMTEMFAKQAEATRLRREADEAEALGTPEGLEEARRKRGEAAALDRQVQAQEKLIRSLSELPKEMRDGIIGAMTTGGIVNEGAEVLARQGVLDDILEITSNLKERAERGEQVDPEMEAQRIMQLVGESQAQNAEVLRNALLVGGDELARKLGFSIKDIEFARDQLGRDRPAELEAARRRREAAEAPGADRAADTAAALQNLSISLNQAANEATAALSPFIQSFNLVTNTAEGTSTALGQLGQAAVNAVNGLLEFGTRIAGGAATIPEKFAGLPTQGGSSTIGRRPPTDQFITPPPPPPTTTAPAQVPIVTPTTTPGAGTQPQGTTETPIATPAGTTQAAPTATATPVPTYAPITVETNLGNRITLNAGAVGKIAGQIKEGKNRDQLRGEIRKLIGNNTNYNQATIDKIIDKVAEVANLPKPAGSAATATPTTPAAQVPTQVQEAVPTTPATEVPTQVPTVAPSTTNAPTVTDATPTTPAATAPQTAPEAPQTTEQRRQTAPSTEGRVTPTAPGTQAPSTPTAKAPTTPTIRITDRQIQWANNRYNQLIKEGKSASEAEAMLKRELGANKYSQDQINEIVKRVQRTAGTTTPQGQAQPGVPEVPAASTAPQVAARVTEAVRSGKLNATTPPSVARQVTKPATQRGSIETSLDKLMQSGLIDPKFIRGPQELPLNPEMLGQNAQGGADKDRKTMDTQGEGYGLSPKLLEGIVKLQNTDLDGLRMMHITALNDYYHAKNFPRSAHAQGRALDFTLTERPDKEQSAKITSILNSLGFQNVKDEYNDPTRHTKGAHFHAEVPQMAKGGIVSGSTSGFPTMLHGNEIIVPLDPNSILADLGKKSQEQIKTEMSTFDKSVATEKLDTTMFRDIARQNQQLMEMLGFKLDNVINKLDTGNDTQSKILQYSQA